MAGEAAEEYRGRRIEVRPKEAEGVRALDAEPVLLIDDEPVGYGQLPDGKLYLQDYAYDWHDDLVDLARSYIDHQDEAQEARSRTLQGED